MKKMIHIAVVPSLAVLLSACAGPGTQPVGTLDDLGPGGLAAVVLKKLRDDQGPGGLKSVVRDTLNQPDTVEPKKTLLQKALLDALQEMDTGNEKDAFVREEVFTFRWGGADPDIQDRFHDKLKEIFSVAQDAAQDAAAQEDGSSGFKIKASIFNTDRDGKLMPIGRPSYTARELEDMPKPSKDPAYKVVVYTAENLAGMTSTDRHVITKYIREVISKIPGIGENRIETPIRMDPEPSRVVIPKRNYQTYVLATGSGDPYPSCEGTTTYQVVGDQDAAGRQVTLFIDDGTNTEEVKGPEYSVKKEGGVLVRRNDPDVMYELVRKIVGVETDRDSVTRGKRTWTRIDDTEWFKVGLGGKKVEEHLKILGIEVGDCVFDQPKTDRHFVLAALRVPAPDPRPTVVHYYVVDLVSAEVEQSYEYTEERAACPPSDKEWNAARSRLLGELEKIVKAKEGPAAVRTLRDACPQ